MIRVAEVVYEPAHSGQAEHVLALVAQLAVSSQRSAVSIQPSASGGQFDIRVCYPQGDALMAARLAGLGVAGAGWPMRRLWNPGAIWALYRLVRRERIDIVHVHGPFAGLWARPAARLAGARIVYTPQTVELRQKRAEPLYLAAERALGHLTDRLISVCEADRGRLIAGGWARPERVVVIPNGIDTRWWAAQRQEPAAARRQLGWPAEAPAVVQVGRLNAQKAPHDFVAAAAIVHRRLPAARFYLAGDGPLRDRLAEQIAAAGLGDVVILLGQRTDVPTLLAAADVVALSSLWEGLPIALLEAGALGRPAICTAVNGSPEVVVDGETGYVVPPGEPAALAGGIEKLLAEPALAERMGERAREWVMERFDARVMGEAVAELYRELAAPCPADVTLQA